MYKLEVSYHWEMFLLPLPLATDQLNQLNPPSTKLTVMRWLFKRSMFFRAWKGWIQPTELAQRQVMNDMDVSENGGFSPQIIHFK